MAAHLKVAMQKLYQYITIGTTTPHSVLELIIKLWGHAHSGDQMNLC